MRETSRVSKLALAIAALIAQSRSPFTLALSRPLRDRWVPTGNLPYASANGANDWPRRQGWLAAETDNRVGVVNKHVETPKGKPIVLFESGLSGEGSPGVGASLPLPSFLEAAACEGADHPTARLGFGLRALRPTRRHRRRAIPASPAQPAAAAITRSSICSTGPSGPLAAIFRKQTHRRFHGDGGLPHGEITGASAPIDTLGRGRDAKPVCGATGSGARFRIGMLQR